MDLSDPINIIVLAVMGFALIAGIVLLSSDGGNSEAMKRAKKVVPGAPPVRSSANDRANNIRKKKTQERLDTMRNQGQDKRHIMLQRDIETKLEQTGTNIPIQTFWIGSAICGGVLGLLVMLSRFKGPDLGFISLESNLLFVVIASVFGGYTIPQLWIKFMTKRRFDKMALQFADAIDMIVRGAKSGLPLNDCLRLISREAPQPMSDEFALVCDNLSLGTNLDQALASFFRRVPLPEVNFFVTVLVIQQKSGGNLSEALGNLSDVLRARRLMKEKIKAMAAEALWSARIIGGLPIAVGGMVFLTSPDYISILFEDPTGHFILMIAAMMMGTGTFVMKRMMNFDI